MKIIIFNTSCSKKIKGRNNEKKNYFDQGKMDFHHRWGLWWIQAKRYPDIIHIPHLDQDTHWYTEHSLIQKQLHFIHTAAQWRNFTWTRQTGSPWTRKKTKALTRREPAHNPSVAPSYPGAPLFSLIPLLQDLTLDNDDAGENFVPRPAACLSASMDPESWFNKIYLYNQNSVKLRFYLWMIVGIPLKLAFSASYILLEHIDFGRFTG